MKRPEPNHPSSVDTAQSKGGKAVNLYDRLHITPQELRALFRYQPDPEKRNAWLVFMVGVLLTPISLIGALLGFVRGYHRILAPDRQWPWLHPMKPIIRLAMISGAVLLWLVVLLVIFLLFHSADTGNPTAYLIVAYLAVNSVISWIAFIVFRQWQYGLMKQSIEHRKFGSARFAEEHELERFRQAALDGEGTGSQSGERKDGGIYIGGGFTFSDKGHLCTVSGTRGGKGTNLIIPNLLGLGDYQGSWVVIDPKGENAAITARYQRESGRKVVCLNPWGMFEDRLGECQAFNPMDILDTESIHLVDDVQMIAEMIIPIENDPRNRYFSDNARTIVTAILTHIAVNLDKEHRHLGMLYKLARYGGDDWRELLADMRLTKSKKHVEMLDSMAQEIDKLMQSGENSFGSIVATMLQGTDFLKSPALQKALKSGYDPHELANGNTCLYIIIPADKLQSHGRWLRLVVTSSMRAIIRKPGRKVTFLLDEFAALGYLPEIETALSTYAGYNVTIWPILQSLIQLQKHYGRNWETFVANTAVRHFFNINDNFSAEYVSKALGETTNVVTTGNWMVGKNSEVNHRRLVTPDEVRRYSQHNIFAFIGDAPPTAFGKRPYYTIGELVGEDGKARYDENPYL